MKNYYEELKQFYKDTNNTERLAKLEKFKADNKEVEIIKLYNDYRAYKKSGLKESKDKFTKSKLKQYIKEIIINTLNENEDLYQVTTDNEEETMLLDSKKASEFSKAGNIKSIKKLEELEPNSKQKLKLANKELAFLAKQVRSLEKQLKSPGSDENEG
jgi:predicted DNA-binding protein